MYYISYICINLMLQGLSQPLTLCGSQRNFSQGWLSHAPPPASVVPSAKASPVFLQPGAADEMKASLLPCCPALPGVPTSPSPRNAERCGPESRSRDAKGAGRKGSVRFATAGQGEGENKAPCSPLSSLAPFSFSFTPERREGGLRRAVP